jgi:hypothetical protein
MPSQTYSGGAYATVRDLCREGSGLVAVILPSLALILEQAERQKGEPLTEAEVNSIRDRAPAIQMHRADFIKWAAARGRDLDPDNAWAQWQARRSL